MKILVDENLPRIVADHLVELGHLVRFARELGLGRPDAELLGWAGLDELFITEDKDFGDLIFRDQHATHGVLLVRLAGVSPSRRAALVAATVTTLDSTLFGRFTVLSAGGIRTQSRPSQAP